jgi:hypothetical protein
MPWLPNRWDLATCPNDSEELGWPELVKQNAGIQTARVFTGGISAPRLGITEF